MSRKIIGVTVGTPISPKAIERKLKPVKTVNGVEPDENGNVDVAGNDGFSPVAKVTQTDTGAVISITDKEGTTTATVANGKDGAKGDKGDKGDTGAKGDKGDTGEKGEDGVSPNDVYVLSENESVENAPEDVKFIVDPYGEVPTYVQTVNGIAPDKNGNVVVSGGGSGGAQSDWNAKEGEPGHVLNRTHFAEKVEIDHNFDNDLTGREVLPIAAGVNIVKIADHVLTEAECIGAEVSFVMDGQASTMPITENGVVDLTAQFGISCFMATPDAFLSYNLPFVAVIRESGTVQGTAVSAGTYYVSASNISLYVSHFSALEGVTQELVHKLDNRYLDMEWIPKVAEVEIVPTTYTTFERTGRQDRVDSSNQNSTDLVIMPASAVVFGDSYDFYIDGKKYTAMCYDPYDIDPDMAEYGGVSALFTDGDSSNNENIVVYYGASDSKLWITVAGEINASVPVRITKTVTPKLPEKFLPETTEINFVDMGLPVIPSDGTPVEVAITYEAQKKYFQPFILNNVVKLVFNYHSVLGNDDRRATAIAMPSHYASSICYYFQCFVDGAMYFIEVTDKIVAWAKSI